MDAKISTPGVVICGPTTDDASLALLLEITLLKGRQDDCQGAGGERDNQAVINLLRPTLVIVILIVLQARPPVSYEKRLDGFPVALRSNRPSSGVRTKILLAIVRQLSASAKFAEIDRTRFVGPAITSWC